jgi:hypothetical protein
VVEVLATENEAAAKKFLTSLNGLPLCRTTLLDRHREYYVRISAHVRPPGATLLGWATGVTNLAKFTFVPEFAVSTRRHGHGAYGEFFSEESLPPCLRAPC